MPSQSPDELHESAKGTVSVCLNGAESRWGNISFCCCLNVKKKEKRDILVFRASTAKGLRNYFCIYSAVTVGTRAVCWTLRGI